MSIQVHGAKTFRDLHPGLSPQHGANEFYFRYDWAPQQVLLESASGTPRWTARTSAGDAASLLSPDSGNPRRIRLARPPQPGWVQVSDGGSGQGVRIWFVRATLQVVGRGRVSSHNPRWSAVQAYLTTQYGAQGGHDFGRLGPTSFRSVHAATDTDGIRYGGMVEIIGAVEPADFQRHVRIPMFQARRITGVRLSGRDAQGRPLLPSRTGFSAARPGQNDTSLFRPQDAAPLGVFTGELTATGHILDYDMPGAIFTSENWAGDVHEYNVEFEQVVWIGSCSSMDPWPEIESRGLALSPVVRWAVHLRAELTSTATSPGGMRVNLTGTVG
ncbi:hypothetical protein F183_A07430 [Bryobacterales bacterium F-183]|nr:hypothetical protein F183_A07430 [Bryobacterales bacterium F-183]